MGKEYRGDPNVSPRQQELPKNLEDLQLHPDAKLLLQCFAYSQGRASHLGQALYMTGILPHIGDILGNQEVLEQVMAAQAYIHPNMEKHHAKNGYSNANGVVAIIFGGINSYERALKSKPLPHSPEVTAALEKVAEGWLSIHKMLLARPELKKQEPASS